MDRSASRSGSRDAVRRAGRRLALLRDERRPVEEGRALRDTAAVWGRHKAAPLWHPEDENIVVLQGTFAVGIGDIFDPSRARDIPTDGYGLVPARTHHFAVCKGETDILVYGTGPRLNNWLPAPSDSGGK
jgi:hypothetical protein